MDFKVVITVAKPGIEIALYLATYSGRRKGNLHEFTYIYVTLHLKRRAKNFEEFC